MLDDLVYDFVVFNKGNNSHGSPAFGTDEGIDTVYIESCMTPLQYLLDKVLIDQLLAEEKREDFKCEQRALELDDTLAEVHFLWASIKTWNDWDWEGGEQAFKRALEIKPNFAQALVYYSNLLCYMGRLDESLEKAERAVRLDLLRRMNLPPSK